MGFFKKRKDNVVDDAYKNLKPDADQEHLTPEGHLPCGWHSINKQFTDKIQSEYSYFLNSLIDSKDKSPKEKYSALKSYVLYMNDAKALCYSKNECFAYWFDGCIASDDYIEQCKAELSELESNLDSLQKDWNTRKNELNGIDDKIKQLISENEGILQSDFVKMFDSTIQNDVKEKLYFMEKDGQIQRTKSGRSYILHTKN